MESTTSGYLSFVFTLQISFSYARSRDEWNVVKIEGFDEEQDQNRLVFVFVLNITLYYFLLGSLLKNAGIEQGN